MTKLSTFVISGALLVGATVAQAADKAPAAAAPSPAAAPAKAPTSAPLKAPAAAPAAEKAAAPAGDKAAPMEMPKPAPEIDALYKGWEGSWKCDTTFVAGSMGPGSPEMKVKSDVKIKKDLGGYWYRGEFKIKKTKTFPGIDGVFMLGFDPGAKTPVSLTYDSMGGYAVESGTGAADKIVFVGDGHMMGMKSKFRETMTKKSDKEMEHSFDVDMGKGFAPMGVDTCKK